MGKNRWQGAKHPHHDKDSDSCPSFDGLKLWKGDRKTDLSMRRIDVIGIGLGVFLLGGGLYLGFRIAGFDGLSAGVWSQVIFVAGLLGWVATYLFRVVTSNMTYGQQLKNYEDAVLQKRLDEMTPKQWAELEAKLAADQDPDHEPSSKE